MGKVLVLAVVVLMGCGQAADAEQPDKPCLTYSTDHPSGRCPRAGWGCCPGDAGTPGN